MNHYIIHFKKITNRFAKFINRFKVWLTLLFLKKQTQKSKSLDTRSHLSSIVQAFQFIIK